jgi:hypothetical protein
MTMPAQRPLSLAGIWDDAGGMLRANAGILSAIAGVFLLLPSALITRYAPPPARGGDVWDYLTAISDYSSRHWPEQLAAALAGALGAVAIYLLLLGTPRITVAAALGRSLMLLPGYFAVSLIVPLAFFLGLIVFFLPGLYLLARLIAAGPAVVVEAPNAPFAALQRAWALSRGRAWQILLMLASVYLVATVLAVAVQQGLGTLLLLFAGTGGVALTLLSLLQGLVSAMFGTVLLVLICAIYRALRD